MEKMIYQKKAYQTPVMEVCDMEQSPLMLPSSPLHTNVGLVIDSQTGDAEVSRSRGLNLFEEEDLHEFDKFWLSDN